jgi:hypothetical protein
MKTSNTKEDGPTNYLVFFKITLGLTILFFFSIFGLAFCFALLFVLLGVSVPATMNFWAGALISILIALLWMIKKGGRSRQMLISIVLAWLIAVLAILFLYSASFDPFV